MKAFLMYRAGDFDLHRPMPPNEAVLVQDLELDTLLQAMALKDQLTFDVAKKVILTSIYDGLETISYRQDALRDSLKSPSTIRELYLLAGEAIERQKKVWGLSREYPTGLLDNAVSYMQMYLDVLRRVRDLADRDIDPLQVRGLHDAFHDARPRIERRLFRAYQCAPEAPSVPPRRIGQRGVGERA